MGGSLSIPLSSWPDAVSVRVPEVEQTEKQGRYLILTPHPKALKATHVLFTWEDERHTPARGIATGGKKKRRREGREHARRQIDTKGRH